MQGFLLLLNGTLYNFLEHHKFSSLGFFLNQMNRLLRLNKNHKLNHLVFSLHILYRIHLHQVPSNREKEYRYTIIYHCSKLIHDKSSIPCKQSRCWMSLSNRMFCNIQFAICILISLRIGHNHHDNAYILILLPHSGCIYQLVFDR